MADGEGLLMSSDILRVLFDLTLSETLNALKATGNNRNSYWLILFSTSCTKSEGQLADQRGNDNVNDIKKRLPPAGL